MSTDNDGYLSTSRLAKELGLSISNVFDQLHALGLVEKVGERWELTESGRQRGGKYLSSPKYGTWIAWPRQIIAIESATPGGDARKLSEVANERKLTATTLGRVFAIPATRMNYILSELGWIQKSLKGWKITAQGLAVGGEQREDARSGVPYVAWPEAITANGALRNTMDDIRGTPSPEAKGADGNMVTGAKDVGFRERFPAEFRATDGHFVRSRSEMLIDNWLYMAEIVHAYERKLPVGEDVYCDFYLPAGKLYIEFWGMENDPKYAERMKVKQSVYAKCGFNLIDLNDEDVHNLDDILPAKLLKYGVQAY